MATFIHGIAASENIDSSGERIIIAGLDISSLDKDGVFNYEHKSDQPSQIVGKVLKAKRIFSEKDCEDEHQLYFWNKILTPFLYVMGELFDDYKDSAREVAGMFKYDAAKKGQNERNVMNFSIEGAKIDKKGMDIARSIARKVTLTATPCNKAAVAEMVPATRDPAKLDADKLFKTENVEIELFQPNKELIEFLAKKESMKKDLALTGGAPTSPMLMGELKKDQPLLHPPTGAHSSAKVPTAPKSTKRFGGMSSTTSMTSVSSGGLAKAQLPPMAPAAPRQTINAPKGYTGTVKQGPGGTEAHYNHPEHGIVSIHQEGGMYHVKHNGAVANVKGVKGSFTNANDAVAHAHSYMNSVTSGMTSGNKAHNRSSPAVMGMPELTTKPPSMKKALEAGSGMAAPSQLVQGAALAPESLSRKIKKINSKSRWLARAEEEYDKWEHKEKFRDFMKKKMPHLAKGEIDAIGKTIALDKAMKEEKAMKKFSDIMMASEKKK